MAGQKTGIIAAVLGIILAVLKIWLGNKKERAAASTPGKRAEHDKKKVNDAIARRDSATLNDMFNKL